MTSSYKTAVFVLIWTFQISLLYMVVNTTIFGNFIPIMDDMAANSSYVNMTRYTQNTLVLKSGLNIALFILLLCPYIYIFGRLLLKREAQPAQPVFVGPGGGF